MIVHDGSDMVWHLARAFTRQELESRAGKESQVIVQYVPDAGWYEFRIMSRTRDGLSRTLDVLEAQIDRMRQELADDGR